MTNKLSDTQQAALQVMGISMWRSNAVELDELNEKSLAVDVPQPTLQQCSSEWLDANKNFVSDVTTAVAGLQNGGENSKPTISWCSGKTEKFEIDQHKLFVPVNSGSLSSQQKRQLWQLLCQSHSNAD